MAGQIYRSHINIIKSLLSYLLTTSIHHIPALKSMVISKHPYLISVLVSQKILFNSLVTSINSNGKEKV